MCVLLLSVHYVDPKTSLERSRTFSKGTVVVTVLAQCHPQYVLAVCVARAETLRCHFSRLKAVCTWFPSTHGQTRVKEWALFLISVLWDV